MQNVKADSDRGGYRESPLKFISRNRELWGRMCEHFKIDPKAPQYHLGEGSNGEVFELSDGRVLKLSWDEKEARAAARVAGNEDPLGNVFKCSGVAEVRTKEGSVWAIMQEKLSKMSASDPWVPFIDCWAQYSGPDDYITPEYIPDFLEYAEKFMHLKDDDDWNEGFKPWITQVAAYLGSPNINIKFSDLHTGNVMKRGSQYVLIDLGYSVVPETPIHVVSRRLLALADNIPVK